MIGFVANWLYALLLSFGYSCGLKYCGLRLKSYLHTRAVSSSLSYAFPFLANVPAVEQFLTTSIASVTSASSASSKTNLFFTLLSSLYKQDSYASIALSLTLLLLKMWIINKIHDFICRMILKVVLFLFRIVAKLVWWAFRLVWTVLIRVVRVIATIILAVIRFIVAIVLSMVRMIVFVTVVLPFRCIKPVLTALVRSIVTVETIFLWVIRQVVFLAVILPSRCVVAMVTGIVSILVALVTFPITMCRAVASLFKKTQTTRTTTTTKALEKTKKSKTDAPTTASVTFKPVMSAGTESLLHQARQCGANRKKKTCPAAKARRALPTPEVSTETEMDALLRMARRAGEIRKAKKAAGRRNKTPTSKN